MMASLVFKPKTLSPTKTREIAKSVEGRRAAECWIALVSQSQIELLLVGFLTLPPLGIAPN